jgi:hypothetical protein
VIVLDQQHVIFSGGVQDYLLAWGSFTFPLIGGQNTFNSGAIIPAGIYPYSATDLNGCPLIDTITIYQPDSLYTSYSFLITMDLTSPALQEVMVK